MSQQIRDLEVVGKDIVGAELPVIITSENTAEEFASGKTWGRVLRLRRGGNHEFHDIGLDQDGNLFVNTKNNNATSHVLTISADGNVRIVGNLRVIGKLVEGQPESQSYLKTVTGLDFQHAWAGSTADQIGGVTLEAVGNVVQGAEVSGLAATPVTTKAFQFNDNTTDAVAASTPDVDDINDTSMLVACLFRTRSGAPSGARGLVGKRESAAPNRGWEVQYDARGTLGLAVDTGDARVATMVAGAHTDNAWHVFVMVYDNASKQVRFGSDLGSAKTLTLAASGTSPRVMSIGANRLRAGDTQIALVAVATGDQVASVDPTALATMLRGGLVA